MNRAFEEPLPVFVSSTEPFSALQRLSTRLLFSFINSTLPVITQDLLTVLARGLPHKLAVSPIKRSF